MSLDQVKTRDSETCQSEPFELAQDKLRRSLSG